MMGYCSNSPLRCHHAHAMEVLNQTNNSCPNCGMSLVPVNNLFISASFEQRVLQLSLAVTAILLLVMVDVYYAHLI